MGKKISIFINIVSIILLLALLIPRILLFTAKEEPLGNFIGEYLDNCHDYRLYGTKYDEYYNYSTTNQEDILEIFNYTNDLKVKNFSKTNTFNPYENHKYTFYFSAKNEDGANLMVRLYVYEKNYIKVETYKSYNTQNSKEYNFKITNLTNYEMFDNIIEKIK